jgi:hypothetical protein
LRSNNATHGIIQVIVDIEKGAKPSEVEVYYARTLEYDRLIDRWFLFVLK